MRYKDTYNKFSGDNVLRPIILEEDSPDLTGIKKRAIIVDYIDDQLRELELLKNPQLISEPDRIELGEPELTLWVYYPWKNTLVHVLAEKDFKILRISRNLNLINKEEQRRLEKFRVGIAGLNVGNPGALCLALEGDIEMKLTDNDILSLSNLNRFRAGLVDLGLNKAVLTARQIYEINPFAMLEIFKEGISEENINEFLLSPKLDILVEEMDSLPLKIKIRELAKSNKIPVVMVTGNGPDVIIDVERFDLEPDLPLLSGYLKEEVIEGIKKGPKDFNEKIKLARDFMGEEYLHPRLVSSFKLVGKSLAGIPQIAESSFLRGAAIAYVVRQIAQKEDVKSGRYNLNLSNVR